MSAGVTFTDTGDNLLSRMYTRITNTPTSVLIALAIEEGTHLKSGMSGWQRGEQSTVTE